MKKHRSAQFAVFLAIVLCALCLGLHSAPAAVVVSNLDAGNPDFAFGSPQLGQAALIGNRPISLTSVEFLQTDGFTTGETFAVYSRNADGTLGTSLLTGFSFSFDSSLSVTTATPTQAFTLQANTGYFFVLNGPTPTTDVEWSYTSSTDYAAAFGVSLPATNSSFNRNPSTGVTGYYNLADGPQEFQVNGTAGVAVPEPSVFAMIVGGIGLLSVCLVGRRRFV